MVSDAFKRRLPAPLKRAVKNLWRRHVLSRTVRQIRRLPDGVTPGRELLARLEFGWGNDGFSGNLDYLERVALEAYRAKGPILECGSGLTTLLLGLLAGRRGIETWALEHSELWHRRITTTLARLSIPATTVRLAPLREHGNLTWYSVPPELPADFTLVVCDGPVNYADRYGVLPILGDRLRTGALILVDDPPEMAAVMEQWQRELPLELVEGSKWVAVLRKSS